MTGSRFFFGNAVTAKRLRSKGCYRYRVTKEISFPSSFGQGHKSGAAAHHGNALRARWRRSWLIICENTGGKLGVPLGRRIRKFGQGRVILDFRTRVGTARQVARRVLVVLEIKNLQWLLRSDSSLQPFG